MTQVLICNNFADPSSLETVLLVKKGDMTVTVKNASGLVYEVYSCNIFPAEFEQELREILIKRAAFKKEFEDSMSLVYKLRNKIAKGN